MYFLICIAASHCRQVFAQTRDNAVHFADSLISAKAYDECISLCKSRGNSLNDRIGECYYQKNDPAAAVFYLGKHFDKPGNDSEPQISFYAGIYADALFRTGKYGKAAESFGKYFELAEKLDGMDYSGLQYSKSKASYGYMFYNFAYSCLFTGNEILGKRQLEYAARCGHADAAEDLACLNQTSSFAVSPDPRSRYKAEWDAAIAKYDIKDRMVGVSPENPGLFWIILKQYGRSCQEMSRNMEKGRVPKMLAEADRDIGTYADEMRYRLSYLYPYKKGDVEQDLDMAVFGGKSPLKDLRIYPAAEAGAFATPYGHVYITEKMARRLRFSTPLLSGIVAAQTVHYLSGHAKTTLADTYEKRRNKEIIMNLGSKLGANAGTAGYDGAETAPTTYRERLYQIGSSMMEVTPKDANYVRFRYNREQILEADILAYRFCEAAGIGGHSYILALEIIGDGEQYSNVPKGSDLPSLDFRVMMLKYLEGAL